ncbi:alanine racemase [Alicyclobacillus dauci]|uniref:Alanine racemase n=1 Tax=Alicyclobacillus dauci TaxID=1475485 RepID=A0ABY6Z1X0_9BACL|nr:alanine racemase [Alicyclobacillus dauci]WAH36682.1 alanine racemase [Alicyclobacillus dauci]
MYRGTFAIVDLSAFADNLRLLAKKLREGTKMLIAVKANAYGHDIGPIMEVIARSGVAQVAVATLEEALTIRKLGFDTPVLILGALGPHELRIASENDIDVIHTQTWGPVQTLGRFERPLKVHIPLDTGMNRVGFKSFEDVRDIVDAVLQRSDLKWQGIYTHLACSDAESDEHSRNQIRIFSERIEQLKRAGYDVPMAHVSNSGGVLRNAEWNFDMVRIGIAAYGYSPDETILPEPGLQPVMHVYSSITRVASVTKGETIGYGATFTASKNMRVATVAIGYADGYPRILSNRGKILLRGVQVPVVGRVCMDQLMIDVSDVPDVRVGEFVTVFGRAVPSDWTPEAWEGTDPEERDGWIKETFQRTRQTTQDVLSLTEIAALAETIPYEVVCGMSSRVPKLHVN